MGEVRYSNGLYTWYGPFEERHIPPAAGFVWDFWESKRWCTTDPVLAANLKSIFSSSAKVQFEKDRDRIRTRIKESRMKKSAPDCPYTPPEGLELFPFQSSGIANAHGRDAVLIGDEMGLGKTVQAIGLIEAAQDNKSLVICPAFLKDNWLSEINTWAPGRSVEKVSGKKVPSTNADITVINYDILHNHSSWLKDRAWDRLVFDEAHYMMTHNTRRTVHALGGKYKRTEIPGIPAHKRLYLSGTPIDSRPKDIYPILSREDPYGYGNLKDFEDRYCTGFYMDRKFIVTGAKNAEELQNRLRSWFMIRRLKKDVLHQLPPKTREIIELQIPGIGKLIQEETKLLRNRSLADVLSSYERDGDNLQQGEMAKIRKAIGLAKVDACVRFIENLLNSVEKVVIFGHHQEVLERLQKALPKAVLVYGKTPMNKRTQYVNEFQNGCARCFVGNIQAAGVGLTLTKSHVAVFVEQDWGPGKMNQAEDRIHRIGQMKNVLIYYPVVSGSLEVRITESRVRKQEIVDKTLDRRTSLVL